MIQWIDPERLETIDPFKSLWPMDAHLLEAIMEDMREHGYDESEPIDTWDGAVIDGHTRRLAAITAEIGEVAYIEHRFDSEDVALEYAIKKQRNRRNLDDSDILRLVAELDRRREHGGDRRSDDFNSSSGLLNGSRQQTADVLGISPTKVQRTRTVLDHADDETREQIFSGEKSINKAYNETQERRKHEKQATKTSKPTFNRSNDNIEWAWWSWNPVTGCKNGCKYCYARDIANRFYDEKFEPTFRPERLSAPRNTTVPILPDDKQEWDKRGSQNVFVCSMADLFGDWVPQEWIDAVLQQVEMSPQWNFLFLSKNPERLETITWPRNAWVGTTVDIQDRVEPAKRAFENIDATVKFLSCEPFLERLDFGDMSMFDWVLIGSQSKSTQCREFQPKQEWVKNLMRNAWDCGCAVYIKPNMTTRIREYP